MTDQEAKKKPRPHKPRTGHPRNFSSDPDRATARNDVPPASFSFYAKDEPGLIGIDPVD
jgi:hypothetical protein